MPDIVSQGGDRGPGPWPRWIVAAVVLVLVAAGLTEHFTHPRAHPAGADPASTQPVADSGAPVSVPGRATGPDGLTGPATSWPSGLELVSAGVRPARFWPATAQLRLVGGLPAWPPGYQFTRTPSGWAVQAGPGAQGSCGGCAGPPQPVYYLADGAPAARQVGAAYAVAPGATAATLWLTSYPSGADPFTAAGLAQQVSVTGAPAGPPVTLPAGQVIAQGTGRGLLLAPAAPRPGQTRYELWVPGARQAGRVFTGVVAVAAREIAWSAPCQANCRVQVLNLATGHETSAVLPAAGSVANAAFSPDGRYLALQVTYSNNGDDGALAIRLYVVALPAGHLALVPHTFASSDAMVGFGWPAHGDTLVAELSFTTKLQLAAWRPGAARLAVVTLGPRRTPPSLVIAAAIP